MGVVPPSAEGLTAGVGRRIDNNCEEETVTVLDNLTLLAVIIIVVWMAALAFYFYTSRQQKEIREELEAVRALLEEDKEAG